MRERSCLLLGATGLVGGELLRLLLADERYRRVTALVRRALPQRDAKLVVASCDLGRPETYAEHVPVDDVFCCLGTTIKKAGSQEAFRQVDYTYPLAVARAAGASRYFIVTAVGSDARSSIFYNRVKGEVEDALRQIPFSGGLHIFRPSMLLGERGESRPAERAGAVLMQATAPLFIGGLKRYRAIPAAAVARAMWKAAGQESAPAGGVQVYEGASLFELGEGA